jgi:hypothetical protein
MISSTEGLRPSVEARLEKNPSKTAINRVNSNIIRNLCSYYIIDLGDECLWHLSQM